MNGIFSLQILMTYNTFHMCHAFTIELTLITSQSILTTPSFHTLLSTFEQNQTQSLTSANPHNNMLSALYMILVTSFALLLTSFPVTGRTQAPYSKQRGDVVEGDYIVHFYEGHTLALQPRQHRKESLSTEWFQGSRLPPWMPSTP